MKQTNSNSRPTLLAMLLALVSLGAGAEIPAQGKVADASGAKDGALQAEETSYASRPQAAAFAEEMAARGVDPEWVMQALRQTQRLESVRKAAQPRPSGQRRNWDAYRGRFVTPTRTEAGIEFLEQYGDVLERASHQYGVPVEVILGILGVETSYGQNTGGYRVVDSLATLAFDFPVAEGKDRSPYFREQLAHFFVWCSKEQRDPLSVKGSYAGAIGLPQFMPENIHRYGTDFDGDGQINLYGPVDAIGSVARFLALHGWVRGLAPTGEVNLEGARLEPLLEPDILPSFTPMQLLAHGAKPLSPVSQWEKYAVVALENGENDNVYVLGSRNFYVLTRYNRSSYYAMAVLELGREVMSAMETEMEAGSVEAAALPARLGSN